MPVAIDAHSRIGPGRPEEARTPDAALAEMDGAGIAVSWVCPSDAYAAVRNEEGNEAVAAAVRAHPGRFVGCAVANPWWGDGGVRILRKAFRQGLRVLFLHPAVQGFQIDDPLVDPLIEAAADHGAPVYVDTGTPVCSEPPQLAALARRFPSVAFIMGHMGYADFWYDAVPAAQTAPNILIETSHIDPDLLASAIDTLGPCRFMFGSAAPRSSLNVELAKVAALRIPPEALDRILGGTAAELLP